MVICCLVSNRVSTHLIDKWCIDPWIQIIYTRSALIFEGMQTIDAKILISVRSRFAAHGRPSDPREQYYVFYTLHSHKNNLYDY